MKKMLAVSLMTASLCAFSPEIVQAAPEAVASASVSVANDAYMMCAGDQLQITVYGHEDLSSKPGTNFTPYVVRPDGKLSMPLIGDIDVRNKSANMVTQEITERLSEYIVNPQVTINIVKLGSTRVYIFGEVKTAGLFELEKSHNLLDAIGKAGGFTEMAAKKKVYVIRKGETEPMMKVNLHRYLTKGDLSQNVTLNEGDCVYITSNGKFSFARDLMPLLNGVYMVSEIKENKNF